VLAPATLADKGKWDGDIAGPHGLGVPFPHLDFLVEMECVAEIP
jgi:hypothetical protein